MHIVIIGNGIAGVTAARVVRKRRPDWRITLVSDEAPTHYARTAWMYVFMGHLTLEHTRPYEEHFWADNRMDRIHDRATSLDTSRQLVALASGETLAWDRLLVATGSVSAFYDWPGQDLPGVQGLYHVQDLERMERDASGAKEAVVVGGGLIGVELAEMLRTRGTDVTFLVRDDRYLGHALPEREARIVEAEIRRHGVDLRLSTEPESFHGNGRVELVRTTDGDEIPAEWVGIGTGVRPNIDWLAGSGIETEKGVLVDAHLRTNVPEVWAAGDCAELREPMPGRKPIEALWYTGRIAGATAGYNLAGEPRAYNPGVYFNSAKFFDIEWQVVGSIAPDPAPDRIDATAEDETRSGPRFLRLQADAHSGALLGVHALGVRIRQDTITDWIRRGLSLDDAVRDFRRASFDPELSRRLPRVSP